jgi:prepilin peptidase CpaA
LPLLTISSLAFFAACVLAAAVSDLLTMTIPNRLTLALAAAFPVAAASVGMELPSFGWHLAAGALVLVVCFGFFAMGWLGGGDAKLGAGVALWLGFESLMPWLLATALIGGALTLFILAVRRVPLPALVARQDWALRLHAPETGVPYGIAISAGALWILPMTFWVKLLS